jgi:hypothetical protein
VKSFPAFGIMLKSKSQLDDLRELLQKNSNLPGPRANLELMYSFARSVGGMHLSDWQWDFIVEMASTTISKAPLNTPKEFIPVCGLAALGALYGQGLPRPRRRQALAALKKAASDHRWRVREAVAMGLQLLGEADPALLREIVSEWLPDSTLLEKRAIAAGLAHPPLLKDEEFAGFALESARTLAASVTRLDPKGRQDEGFKILRQGLGYSLSVFVHHSPAEGFPLMRKLAAVRDRDMAWIVRENLKKKRLSDSFPKEVEQVALILDEANPG